MALPHVADCTIMHCTSDYDVAVSFWHNCLFLILQCLSSSWHYNTSIMALPHVADTALLCSQCTVHLIPTYQCLFDIMAYFLCCSVLYYFFLILHYLNDGTATCCWHCTITLTLHCTSDTNIAVSFWHNIIFLMLQCILLFFLILHYLNDGTAMCCWHCIITLTLRCASDSNIAMSFRHNIIFLMLQCLVLFLSDITLS